MYCQFLIAAQTNFTATNFSSNIQDVAHDSITRFLFHTKLTPKIIWEYTKPLVNLTLGNLIIDDSVLDHWYGEKIGLTRWQYSGTHHRVVHGIVLTTLLWTGERSEHVPIDFRIYAPDMDGATKNEHCREMFTLAHHRGIQPKLVLLWTAGMRLLILCI